MSEKTAVIKDVCFGCRDVGRPVLSFTVELEGGLCSLQVLDSAEACQLITKYQIVNVNDLEGQMCIVEDGKNTMRFLRMWGKSN